MSHVGAIPLETRVLKTSADLPDEPVEEKKAQVKKCTKCLVEKTVDQFYVQSYNPKSHKLYYTSKCKGCVYVKTGRKKSLIQTDQVLKVNIQTRLNNNESVRSIANVTNVKYATINFWIRQGYLRRP